VSERAQDTLGRFRDPDLARAAVSRCRGLLERAADRLGRRPVLMEVCGTHTVAISRSGIRDLLKNEVDLRSGPGCPVCVTSQRDVDYCVLLARNPEVTLFTFGDMVRVPGSTSSLAREQAAGADVRVVYSPLDAVEAAADLDGRQAVFLAVGFETTAPVVAAALGRARSLGLRNFSVVALHKVIPPAMEALLDDPEIGIDGFILPGHVSAIIGRKGYAFLERRGDVPASITGFEPLDVLAGVTELAAQIAEGRAEVTNVYTRAVPEEGNPAALAAMRQYLIPADVEWRGLGSVKASGLALKREHRSLDARARFPIEVEVREQPKGCMCGDVLRGKLAPTECGLFGRGCTPQAPIGPCMVSAEGSCAAYYKYHRR